MMDIDEDEQTLRTRTPAQRHGSSSNSSINDEAARAYATMTEHLESWTSPRLTSTWSSKATTPNAAGATANAAAANNYSQDSVQWMKSFASSTSTTTGSTMDDFGTLTPAAKRRRAASSGEATPIMSNHSSSGKYSPRLVRLSSSSPLPLGMVDDEESLWTDKTLALSGTTSTRARLSTTTSTTRQSSMERHEFGRYHDVLYSYLVSRRSVADRRLRLQHLVAAEQQQEQRASPIMALDDDSKANLEEEETSAELEFLSSMASTSMEARNHVDDANDHVQSSSLSETDLWSLLAALRSLGMDALLWQQGRGQQQQAQQLELELELSAFIDQLLVSSKDVTPGKLLYDLYYSSSSPLLLQRRKQILEWLQQCHALKLQLATTNDQSFFSERVRTSNGAIMWPDSLEALSQGRRRGRRRQQQQASASPSSTAKKVNTLDPDAPLLLAHDHSFLSSSTSTSGSAAASVSSTDPLYGKDNDNEAKLLKACLAYMLAGRLDQAMLLCEKQGQPWRSASIGGGQPLDLQVVAVDSSSSSSSSTAVKVVQVGNPHRALWKRTCWALGRSSSSSRSQGATMSSKYESAIYALLSNDVQTALKNPALRTWQDGMYACFTGMLARLEDDVLHRHNLMYQERSDCIAEEEEQLEATSWMATWDESSILEQLESSPFEDMRPTDALHEAIASFLMGKDAVINFVLQEGSTDGQPQDLRLLRLLAHLVLYLDSLTAGTVGVNLPGVDNVKNRFVLQYLHQLGMRPELWNLMTLYASLLPTGILLDEYPPILCNVQDDEDRTAMCKQMRELLPGGMDLVLLKRVVRLLLADRDPHVRLRSIPWLCNSESHLADALVCANMLLRKFFLAEDDQLPRALTFVDQYLPLQVAEFAAAGSTQDGSEDAMDMEDVEKSKLEYGAMECYLDAYKAFRHWKEVLASTPTTAVKSKIVHNRAALNRTELSIADSAERREVVKQKRMSSRKVVEAADAAQSKLNNVLAYPGGWLLEEGSTITSDDEAMQRCKELEVIQSRYLPRAVFMLHRVYDKTASWMADSLDDAVSVLGQTALSKLDSPGDDSTSPLSPLYWIRGAVSLIDTLACEENGISRTFSKEDAETVSMLAVESQVRELDFETEYASYE